MSQVRVLFGAPKHDNPNLFFSELVRIIDFIIYLYYFYTDFPFCIDSDLFNHFVCLALFDIFDVSIFIYDKLSDDLKNHSRLLL